MIRKNGLKVELKITGPYRRCASEFGYGQYYTAVADGIEYAFVCLPRDIEFSARIRKRLYARARRRIIRAWSL